MPVDPKAATEEIEPVRVSGPTLPRAVLIVLAVSGFVLTLLAMVTVAGVMALLRR